jgi:hypothetical protein
VSCDSDTAIVDDGKSKFEGEFRKLGIIRTVKSGDRVFQARRQRRRIYLPEKKFVVDPSENFPQRACPELLNET